MIEDVDKAAVCCARCHYEPSNDAFCQITLALAFQRHTDRKQTEFRMQFCRIRDHL